MCNHLARSRILFSILVALLSGTAVANDTHTPLANLAPAILEAVSDYESRLSPPSAKPLQVQLFKPIRVIATPNKKQIAAIKDVIERAVLPKEENASAEKSLWYMFPRIESWSERGTGWTRIAHSALFSFDNSPISVQITFEMKQVLISTAAPSKALSAERRLFLVLRIIVEGDIPKTELDRVKAALSEKTAIFSDGLLAGFSKHRRGTSAKLVGRRLVLDGPFLFAFST